ncbi:MAG: GtrA family protein [Candidatus Moranbacteria bacterium]|nr:GtrA family protein [Candidatus Moranbacteria bacterium]
MFKKILKQYPAIGQFVRFGLIGGLNTGVDLAILITLMTLSGLKAGVAYTIFKTISFCAAATFSYFMNKRWAFKDKSKTKQVQKFSQFFAVSVVGAVINVTIATLVVNYLKPALGGVLIMPLGDTMWGTIGALGGTAFGLVWNFLGYKLLVFKK